MCALCDGAVAVFHVLCTSCAVYFMCCVLHVLCTSCAVYFMCCVLHVLDCMCCC